MSFFERRAGKERRAESLRIRQALDHISNAVMMVDRDFIVTQVNKATVDLLARNRDAFRTVWPNFEPERIVGMCIDILDSDPAQQRRILADRGGSVIRYSVSVPLGGSPAG